MTRSKAFAVIGITTALGVLDNDSAAAKAGRHSSGAVVPCSLDGINPVYHPAIFGNPAVARSYGFVRGKTAFGAWRATAADSKARNDMLLQQLRDISNKFSPNCPRRLLLADFVGRALPTKTHARVGD